MLVESLSLQFLFSFSYIKQPTKSILFVSSQTLSHLLLSSYFLFTTKHTLKEKKINKKNGICEDANLNPILLPKV